MWVEFNINNLTWVNDNNNDINWRGGFLMIGTGHFQGQQDNPRARTGETQVSGFLILAPLGWLSDMLNAV